MSDEPPRGRPMPASQVQPALRFLRQLAATDPTRQLADRELLQRFITRHDEAAFGELVRRYGPMVSRLCRRVLRDEDDAEDAFQATFLVLSRNAPSVRVQQSVGGWLYRVAYRLAQKARI